VEVDREQDVLDGDDGIPRGKCGIWPDCEQPGKIANAKCQGGQWRARGGCAKDGRGQTWVGLGGVGTHIVQKAWCGERRVNVHAWGQRSWWNVGEGMSLGEGGWCVDPRRRMIWREGRRMSWR
jgi:hypothetical protein